MSSTKVIPVTAFRPEGREIKDRSFKNKKAKFVRAGFPHESCYPFISDFSTRNPDRKIPTETKQKIFHALGRKVMRILYKGGKKCWKTIGLHSFLSGVFTHNNNTEEKEWGTSDELFLCGKNSFYCKVTAIQRYPDNGIELPWFKTKISYDRIQIVETRDRFQTRQLKPLRLRGSNDSA